MPVRAFNNSRLVLTGPAEATFAGAFSIVCLVRPDALAPGTYIEFMGGGGVARAGFGEGSSGKPTLDTPNGTTNSGFVTMDPAVWQTAAVTKAAGSNQGEVHTKPRGSGSWEQQPGGDTFTMPAGTVDTIFIGDNENGTNRKAALIAVIAVFARKLTLAEVQGIDAAASSQQLVTLGATHLWHFNQASTDAPVNDLLGDFDQSGLIGTTVDADNDPVWDFAVTLPPPVNTVAPAASGAAEVGQTLACTQGTWSPAGDTYAYQWQADAGSGFANIAGATVSTLLLAPAQEGLSVRCVVTAQRGASSVSASSNAVGPVAPAPVVPAAQAAAFLRWGGARVASIPRLKTPGGLYPPL